MQSLGSRAATAQKILNHLYQRPLIDAARVGEIADIAPASAYKLIADLEKFGILIEIIGGKRGKMYAFSEYLQLFK